MPFDHLIQNINLPDGTEGVDVGIREEKIIAVEKNLDAEASVTTDGSNCMLSPPFVDSHFHMDYIYLPISMASVVKYKFQNVHNNL